MNIISIDFNDRLFIQRGDNNIDDGVHLIPLFFFFIKNGLDRFSCLEFQRLWSKKINTFLWLKTETFRENTCSDSGCRVSVTTTIQMVTLLLILVKWDTKLTDRESNDKNPPSWGLPLPHTIRYGWIFGYPYARSRRWLLWRWDEMDWKARWKIFLLLLQHLESKPSNIIWWTLPSVASSAYLRPS